MTAEEPLRLLILGAHPDDAEYHAGGLASIYRGLGHVVKMVSVTDGGAGHHEIASPELVQIRRAEAAAAGRVIGAEYVTWDNPDGSLLPTLALREQIIREIRTFQPDLILTHRTCDYHPDHRAVGQAVQDASFMVTVPLVVLDAPALRKDPVVAYMVDRFTKPAPLQGDIVLDISNQVETVVDMLMCQPSQVIEWLPYNRGTLDQLPADTTKHRDFVRHWYLAQLRPVADRYRDQLIATYGHDRGNQVQYAEAYEISEYAAPLDAAARSRLFPFLNG